MTVTTDTLRADLAGLANQGARAEKADNDLTRAAGERRAWINTRIDELAPEAHLDQSAGDEYQALIAERGQLDTHFR